MFLDQKGPIITLLPITKLERIRFKDETASENVYVLYKLDESDQIQIGMVSEIMRRYFPIESNMDNLDKAIAKQYFVNGGKNLLSIASSITDRPVYIITPTIERTVKTYSIVNATIDNGLDVSLNDKILGNYKVQDTNDYSLRLLK